MGRIEKTVFISYRRTKFPWALAIFQNLTQHGYDVFIDYNGIVSGAFERVILENIVARAHFLVLLTPSALERGGNSADWLRREIETALDAQRNIVPLMLEGFDFDTPAIASQLTGKLAALKHYNALSIPPEYFAEAMDRLRGRHLNLPLDSVLHPVSIFAERAAKQEQAAARSAPVWHQHIDWAIGNTGAVDCPEQYLTYLDCILGGGRSCLMRHAIEEARANNCSLAFRLTLITQCHNSGAQTAIALAGEAAVCDYLKKK
jgi:hypothetical protein